MSEFDYWPFKPLMELANTLQQLEANEKLPHADDAFWTKVLDRCQSVDDEGDIASCTAAELAQDVACEYAQAKFTYPSMSGSRDLAVGDLSCAESRLVSAVKGIKGVVFLASHPMEPLWGSDGIKYHTVIVSPAIEPSNTISSQLLGACTFIRQYRPCLLCSSSPALPAIVLAAYNYRETFGRMPIRTALAEAQVAINLTEGEVNAADVDELDAFARTVKPRVRLPPPPPSMAPLDDRCATDGADEVISTPHGTPKLLATISTDLPCMEGTPKLLAAISTDSTITQIDAELSSVATPTKRSSGVSMIGKKHGVEAEAEAQTPKTCPVGGGGKWKRGRDQDVGDNQQEPTSQLKKSSLGRRDATSEELSRGTCVTCEQVGVLGWAWRAVNDDDEPAVLPTLRAPMAHFECCACHDSNDEDEWASNTRGVVAAV